MRQLHGKPSLSLGKQHPSLTLSIPRLSLLIPIEKGKGRLGEAGEDEEEEGSNRTGQRLH